MYIIIIMSEITNNIVVQLARFNDTYATSNSQWTNYQKETITINQGDSVVVTKAFIDTRNLSTNQIVILEDTPLELEMYFYWINNGNPGNTVTGFSPLQNWAIGNKTTPYPPPTFPEYTVQLTLQSVQNINLYVQNSIQAKPFADGRPYLLQYSDNSPFTQTWRYTLKAGSYSPDALASLLTTNMAEVKKETAEALNKPNAVDWFDPFAPKVNLPNIKTLDQPFIVDTNSNSPLWNIPYTSINYKDGPTVWEGVVNSQQNIQIAQNNGLPNWYNGTSGTYSEPPGDVIPQEFFTLLPGVPPIKSLCFKNIISDCPIPNIAENLPIIPPSPYTTVIVASSMRPGLYYQIVTLGELTNWLEAGAGANPTVGENFVCIKTPIIQPNPTINFLQMQLNKQYKVITSGYPWTGPGGFDTYWSLYSNNGAIGSTFSTGADVPVKITLTNNTNITLINLNITYTITATSNINWNDFGENIPFGDPINYKDMVVGNTYEIVNLGITNTLFQPLLYDTNWLELGDTITPIAIGNVFTCTQIYNIPVNPTFGLEFITTGLTYTITSTTNTINWEELGYQRQQQPQPVIPVGPDEQPLLVGYTYEIIDLGYQYGTIGGETYYDTNWAQLGFTSYVNPFTFANVGDRFTTNVNTYTATETNIDNGALLNIVPNGQLLNVSQAGDIDWASYGTVGPVNPDGTFDVLITNNLGNASPTDDTFYAQSYPSGTVRLINSYEPPFTFTATATGSNFESLRIIKTYNGFVNGTGMVKSVEPILPFTFKCTKIPAVLPTNVQYSGSLLPTGTVNFALGEGTVYEVGLNPSSPNFYVYPLKIVSNPIIQPQYNSQAFSLDAGVNTLVGQMINYNFPLVGSTEISLAFNDQANIFQFNYTHSPILQASSPASTGANVQYSEVVGIVHSFTPTVASPFTTVNPGYISSTCKLVSQSGVLFKKMEPANFWFNILGFNKDILVTEEELGLTHDGNPDPIYLPQDLNRFTYERFNDITTRSLLSTAMNFTQSPNFPNSQPSYVAGMFYPNPANALVQSLNSSVIDSWYDYEMTYNFLGEVLASFNLGCKPPNTPGPYSEGAIVQGVSPTGDLYVSPPIWNEAWYSALDQTVTLNASAPPIIISSEYGHYLLEIQGYGDDKNGLLNENAKFNSKAIVSNYYVNQGSFVTQPFQDPQTYIHVGEPITLSNYKIRILEPNSMNVVQGLGSNSSIYIQINKAYSKVEALQLMD